ncbi:MAG TPA: bacterial transcriptional activator domain-containing protein [Verrucomicrobiae bacterium]|nr:bacterial transcriptional activator domain-containing protein [Verrucomicrobiae bacterium]
MLLTGAVLRVRCLGTFTFRSDSVWHMGPAFKRGREFLQYFVSYPRAAASRETLVNAFWPSLDIDTAAHRLHIAAAGARAALRDAAPSVDGIRCVNGAYVWDPSIAIESDADCLLAASRGSSIEAMERAVSLYAGDYLAGEDAEWIYPLRVRCANAYAVILERLAEHAIAGGDWLGGLDYAMRLVEADRSHEGATRLVMRALVATGQRCAALAAYDALAKYLQLHVGLKPTVQTCDLWKSILHGDASGITAASGNASAGSF